MTRILITGAASPSPVESHDSLECSTLGQASDHAVMPKTTAWVGNAVLFAGRAGPVPVPGGSQEVVVYVDCRP